MLDDTKKNLLAKIFAECVPGTNVVNAVKFRANNYEQMSDIDTLEQTQFLERQDKEYKLRLIALAEIKEDIPEAAYILDRCDDLFHILHEQYRSEPDKPVLIDDLVTQLGKIDIIIPYFIQAHILGGYSTTALTPSESILKYKSFSEIVSQQQQWSKSTLSQAITPHKLVEKKIDSKILKEFLHPRIEESSIEQYINGHIRDAVLNSIVAVFDFIRERTKLQEDGEDLINRAFSLKSPYLVFSDLQSESGQSDQKGFIQIFKGAYQGIRNPKAHSLLHDLTSEKAAQYLIFASLLARRVDEAVLVDRSSVVQTEIQSAIAG